MSQIKSLLNNSNSSNYINGNNINPNLRVEYKKIINDLQHQLFFDRDLTHQHRMYILNHRNTIESELIDILNDRIHHLNIDCNIRERLITNLNQFSTDFTHINIYSHINYCSHVNDDSDEETYVDNLTDEYDSSDEYDNYYDDLENLILDQIEMEHDINVFSDNIPGNQDEHTTNNNNHHHSN